MLYSFVFSFIAFVLCCFGAFLIFFIKKLYSSYLVGASNVYDRMIPDYVSYNEDTEQYHAEILKEQERIERELLNFEQDLWEY